MEFHEKLQKLRKNRGLTQEELAESLYVSRTAISKWESGRGLPSIDSLKEISKFFTVSIDELLSCEKVLTIAEKENKDNLRRMCELVLGTVDLCTVILIILPLYPNKMNEHVYSVTLFSYEQIASVYRWLYWGIFTALIILGIMKLLMLKNTVGKSIKIITFISIVSSLVGVVFFAMRREVYALIILFILLIIKGISLYCYPK